MSGTNYFLDTNAIIELLKGNHPLINKLHSAAWIGTSVICIIEFLSFSQLSANDRLLLSTLMQRIHVIPIEEDLNALDQVAVLRRQTKLKLPDAIIAAVIANNAILLSNDSHFKSIPNLSVHTF